MAVTRYKRKKRSQRVRFRRRYARSLFRRSVSNVWSVTKLAVFTFLIAGASIQAWQFWHTSPYVKISKVIFENDIPSGLKKILPVKEGDNIFMLNSWKMEDACLDQFPQLARLTISRRFNRSVIVHGTFREPIGTIGSSTSKKVIDKTGHIFPYDSRLKIRTSLPHLKGKWNEPSVANAAQFLSTMKTELPEFYLKIKQIKTDRIQRVVITLFDGVVIYWGVLDSQYDLSKAQRAETLLKQFNPVQFPATFRFVEENRIVLDRKWKKSV